jgi:hypothetical protein
LFCGNYNNILVTRIFNIQKRAVRIITERQTDYSIVSLREPLVIGRYSMYLFRIVLVYIVDQCAITFLRTVGGYQRGKHKL